MAVVSIEGGGFRIDGRPTYPGRSWKSHRIEGLLFNSRMANAIADDENPSTRGAWSYADGDWDAERSTREFIAALPAYRAHGLLAVCINLSGGSPQGYSWNQPWKICGFARDGTIKPAWAARLDNVIKACDRLGMVVILGLFYGKQSGTFKDEAAVQAAVSNTVDWLLERNATNVLLEIGNEVDLENVWAHSIIRRRALPRTDRAGAAAQRPEILVSTSLIGSRLRRRRSSRRPISCCRTATASTGPTAISSRRRTASGCNSRAGAPRRLSRPADRLQRGRPFRVRQAGQPLGRRGRGRRELGLLRLPHEPRALRGRLPVPAGRLDDLIDAQARFLRPAEGNNRQLNPQPPVRCSR
jgi:hypothetical protein